MKNFKPEDYHKEDVESALIFNNSIMAAAKQIGLVKDTSKQNIFEAMKAMSVLMDQYGLSASMLGLRWRAKEWKKCPECGHVIT